MHRALGIGVQRNGSHSIGESERRLMVAVMRTVFDDCGASDAARALSRRSPNASETRRALAYVASTDRAWPYSFENLCEALGLDLSRTRRVLRAPSCPLEERAAS